MKMITFAHHILGGKVSVLYELITLLFLISLLIVFYGITSQE